MVPEFAFYQSRLRESTEFMHNNKPLAVIAGGSDGAKIPKQACYPDLRFVNDCGKNNLLVARKDLALNIMTARFSSIRPKCAHQFHVEKRV